MMSYTSSNLLYLIYLLILCVTVESFSNPSMKVKLPSSLFRKTRRQGKTSLFLAGSGMGMGVNIKTKGKGKNKKNRKQATKKSSGYDALASLNRLEKKYDELSFESSKAFAKDDDDIEAKDRTVAEFMISVRSARPLITGSNKNLKSVSDWIPVAQLVVARPVLMRFQEAEDESSFSTESTDQKLAIATVSYYCREISQAAISGSSKFREVPRQDLQYSIEPIDSFFKYVHENFYEKKEDNDGINSMGKDEARKILDLETLDSSSDNKKAIKSSYRRKAFELHPDRFVGVDRTPEEADKTNEEFSKVKLAYETLLSSGIADSNGKSWYESQGGKERTEFVGPIDLIPIDHAKAILSISDEKSTKKKEKNTMKNVNDFAISRLDQEIVQTYVLRNQNTN